MAPKNTGSTSGAAVDRKISPQCLKQVAEKPAENLALQFERVKVHSRMRVFTLMLGAPGPHDDPVKRNKCEGIVARYDRLLEELNHADFDDLKTLAQCFISQSNLLYAEHAQLRCDL